MHVNVSVIRCVSGDRSLATTDSTDNLIQTRGLPRGTETKGYRFLHLGQEEESAERSEWTERWRVRRMEGRDLGEDLSLRRPEHSERAMEAENVTEGTAFFLERAIFL